MRWRDGGDAGGGPGWLRGQAKGGRNAEVRCAERAHRVTHRRAVLRNATKLTEDPFETWKDEVLDALTGIQGVRSKPLREIAITAMDNVQRATDFTAKVKLLNGYLRTAIRLTKKG